MGVRERKEGEEGRERKGKGGGEGEEEKGRREEGSYDRGTV